jgi:hypothetical protein
MYVAVRRYEGATDTQKVAQLVEEHFVLRIPWTMVADGASDRSDPPWCRP